MKINFFRALFGTCAGMAIFEKLQFQSFARALLHLFLMSIISAAIIGVGLYPELKRFWRNTLTTVSDNCGSIVCSNKGITPSLAPEKVRSFTVGGPLAVTYLPNGAKSLPEDFQQERSGCGHSKELDNFLLQGNTFHIFCTF